MTQLKPIQSLDTTGARGAESFVHDGQRYLVVPQLAADVEGQPASMTMGNSDIATPVYRWTDGRFRPWRSLPVAGGEDAEFFRIGGRAFLATASLRTGTNPYDLNSHSTIFELERGEFVPFQSIPTFAAKQWKHFSVAGRAFLALAQGVTLEGSEPRHSPTSVIFEWTGTRFEEFQRVKSAWGYNWLFFEVAGESFLAYADHVESSRILRWNGRQFEDFQQLEGKSGRAFCFFEQGGAAWLVFACLHDATTLYAWDGERFARRQAVSGPGGRELRWLPAQERLVLVNFVQGTREQPVPSLQSALYRFEGGQLVVDAEFATLGGTDATAFEEGGQTFLVVSHGLGADIRFKTESKVYRVE